MTTDIVRIPFRGGDVLTVDVAGEPQIILKPNIERFGLDYATQFTKLKARSWATVGQSPTVAEDGKVRNMITVNVRTFLMLLATIDERRVAESVRPLLIAYQREVADVIEAYWSGHLNRRNSSAGPEPSTNPLAEAVQEKFRLIESMPVSPEVKQQLALHVWSDYSGMPVPEPATVGQSPTVAPRPAPATTAVTAVVGPVDPALTLVEQWLDEACEPYGPGTRGSHLHAAFLAWCEARGIPASEQPTMTRLGRRLNDLGFPARGRAGFKYRPVRTVRHA